MAVLSLTLHLVFLLLFLIALPDLLDTPSDTSLGNGSPPSIAMVMEPGTAEGMKLPTPSFASPKVAEGETPSMAPPPPMPQPAPSVANTSETAPVVPPPVPGPQAAAPPPVPSPAAAPSPAPLPAFNTEADADPLPPPSSKPAPPPVPSPAPARQSNAAAQSARKPAPQVMTRNTLPVPVSHTTKQPNRTANSQGATVDSPGPQAVNSEGTPAHSTNGPDLTTSTGGAAGEDGEPALLHRRLKKLVDALTDKTCVGSLFPELHGVREDPQWPKGKEVSIRARFHKKPDGTMWATWWFLARSSIELPVWVLTDKIQLIGQFGTVYTMGLAGEHRLEGTTQHPAIGTISLVCG